MKVYCTVYALTKGIELLDVEEAGDGIVKVKDYPMWYLHVEGKDWHRSWASALERAEEMRQRKIKSLKKSLAKMETLSFKRPTDA